MESNFGMNLMKKTALRKNQEDLVAFCYAITRKLAVYRVSKFSKFSSLLYIFTR